METWINVAPPSANVPQSETVRGIQVQVFASPHEKAALEYKEELHEEAARSGGTLCRE